MSLGGSGNKLGRHSEFLSFAVLVSNIKFPRAGSCEESTTDAKF